MLRSTAWLRRSSTCPHRSALATSPHRTTCAATVQDNRPPMSSIPKEDAVLSSTADAPTPSAAAPAPTLAVATEAEVHEGEVDGAAAQAAAGGDMPGNANPVEAAHGESTSPHEAPSIADAVADADPQATPATPDAEGVDATVPAAQPDACGDARVIDAPSALTSEATPEATSEGTTAVAVGSAAARKLAELSPAACGTKLSELFPALFVSPQQMNQGALVKPIKLRIHADIQARAPGLFSKRTLGIFFSRYTTTTPYLKALAKSPHRFDLDGQPAGDIAQEHRDAAALEVERRRTIAIERRTAQTARPPAVPINGPASAHNPGDAAAQAGFDTQGHTQGHTQSHAGEPSTEPAAPTAPATTRPPRRPRPERRDGARGDGPRVDRPPAAGLRPESRGPDARRTAGPGDAPGNGPRRDHERPPRAAEHGRPNARPNDRPNGPGDLPNNRVNNRPFARSSERPNERPFARSGERANDRTFDRPRHGGPRDAGEAQWLPQDPAQRERALLLRAYEGSTLTKSNFCVLKRMSEADLDTQLALAQQERGGGPRSAPKGQTR